jgi:hypothetical protein
MRGAGSRQGALFGQHKAWQQNRIGQRSRQPSAFRTLNKSNGPWKKGLGIIGGGVGLAAGLGLGEVVEEASLGLAGKVATGVLISGGEHAGSSAGEKLGFYLDNADSVITNILTLFANPLSSFGKLDSRNNEEDMFGSSIIDE